MEMEEETRTALLSGKDMKQIADACNRYSIVSLSYEVIGEEDEDVTLKATISRDEELE